MHNGGSVQRRQVYATVVLTCYEGIGPRQRQRHWIHWLVLLGISIEIALPNDDQLRLSQETFIKLHAPQHNTAIPCMQPRGGIDQNAP